MVPIVKSYRRVTKVIVLVLEVCNRSYRTYYIGVIDGVRNWMSM